MMSTTLVLIYHKLNIDKYHGFGSQRRTDAEDQNTSCSITHTTYHMLEVPLQLSTTLYTSPEDKVHLYDALYDLVKCIPQETVFQGRGESTVQRWNPGEKKEKGEMISVVQKGKVTSRE